MPTKKQLLAKLKKLQKQNLERVRRYRAKQRSKNATIRKKRTKS